MAGIAIAQPPCRQVEHADEEGDEHIGLVVLTQQLVQYLHDVCRIVYLHRGDTEQRVRLGHDDGRRHALAADVADAEEQFLVADEEVEQVAADLTGWCQRAKDVDVVAFREWWKLLGQHRLLNFPGYLQFAADALLLHVGTLQLHDVERGAVCDEDNQQESHQHQQGDVQPQGV